VVDVVDRDARERRRHEHEREVPVARRLRVGADQAEDEVGEAGNQHHQ